MKGLILDAAVKLFEQYGYKNVSIVQITDAINMTTGVFYYHFRSKEEILHTIYEEYITYVTNVIEEVCDMDVDAQEKLRLLILRQCGIVNGYHSYVCIFFREYRNLSEEGLKFVQEKNGRILQLCTSIIEQGIREGRFRFDLDPKIVSLGILGMNNWLYQWYSAEGKYDTATIATMFYNMVGSGLLTSS